MCAWKQTDGRTFQLRATNKPNLLINSNYRWSNNTKLLSPSHTFLLSRDLSAHPPPYTLLRALHGFHGSDGRLVCRLLPFSTAVSKNTSLPLFNFAVAAAAAVCTDLCAPNVSHKRLNWVRRGKSNQRPECVQKLLHYVSRVCNLFKYYRLQQALFLSCIP